MNIKPKLSPHGNRRRLFPDAHIPYRGYIDDEILLSILCASKKEQFWKIFTETPYEFRAKNVKFGSQIQSLFKNNVLYLCDLHDIRLRELFRRINAMGIRGSYVAFLNGNGYKHCSLLYVAMFSRIFNIEAGILIGVDLREGFDVNPEEIRIY